MDTIVMHSNYTVSGHLPRFYIEQFVHKSLEGIKFKFLSILDLSIF